MHPVKKISKEDTWRSDDLKVHIQGHNEESRRRDRSKREEEHRKHRDGESLDRRHRDPDRDARREKEKQRERVSTREGSKHREYSERNLDIKREDVKEDRYKEKRREQDRTSENSRHRDDDKEFVENRRERGETDERNRERRKEKERDRYKDKDRDIEMSKHRDRDTERDREKDKERERRRAERDKERKSESDRKKEERRKERKNLDYSRTEEGVRDKERERERERRERHKARESEYSRHEYEREGERRERHSDKEHSRHKEREHRRDREDREIRRRDKESHDADTRHSREAERERRHKERTESQDYHHGIKDDDRERGEAREREERDRRRDRRHKEASDSKRSDREQKHKESSSYERSEGRKKDKMVENEETEDDKQSSKDYEEDFEDYEEDFEDVDEEDLGNEEEEKHDIRVKEEKRELSPRRREEIEAIQRAIDEENERIYSAKHSTQSTLTESAFPERENRADKGRSHGKIIDFVSAKQREISQKVAKKQKKRSEELLRLIDLDFSITFSLLDLPPVNEYDMYIKNFGTANTKQAYVQCNEDNTDRDIQTEEVDMMDKWTQHPPETKAACGGPKVSQETPDESMARMTIDSQRLTTFLRSATQVMAVLIEENMAESNSLRRLRSQTDAMSFSDGCLQLNTKLPFLHGRQVSLLQFSQAQRQTLLSVHPPSSNSSPVRLDNETIICVWNIWEPSRPQKILLYESEVRCCCFSPGKATLVFAGTAVGSVVVWDLREHSGAHCNLVVGKEEWTLRYPTFSTDAVLSGVGHFSPVVSIEPVLATAGTTSSLIADIEESLGLSFQLGSLDENGVLTLWVVVELPKGNDSGSQTDLGLRPGGKVKLLHSSSLQTTERSSQDMGCGPPVSLQLKFLPSDSNHYFVGTNMGLVRHGTRHSLKVLPKFYRSQFDSCRPVKVTTLDFSPSEEPFFLVGCSDGTVRLHSVQREDPLVEWSEWSSGAPILSVQWSQTRPTVFCVLDAASDLHIWDLTEKDYAPVITENLHNDRVTAMAVFGDPAKQKTFSGVALAKQSGKVEIQYFKKSLTVPSPSDREKLQSVLEDAL